jgi:hypothetical protein
MVEIKKVPRRALRFANGVVVENTAPEGEVPSRFFMVGYTGGKMSSGFFGDIVIDTAGVDIGEDGKKFTILREHDPNRIVGYGTVTRVDGAIHVDGRFSKVTEDGKEVAGLLAEEQPLQASISIDRVQASEVPDDESFEANGRAFSGPVVAVPSSRLREVSFAALGADADTSAIAAADGGTEEVEFLTFKESDMTEEVKEDAAPEVETDEVEDTEEETVDEKPAEGVSKKPQEDADRDAAREEAEKAFAATREDDAPVDVPADRTNLMKEFSQLLEEFGAEFAKKAFQNGWTMQEAKAKAWDERKDMPKEVSAGAEPVAVGTTDMEVAPDTFEAAWRAIKKERNDAGEDLSVGQAMKLAVKLFPELYKRDELKK